MSPAVVCTRTSTNNRLRQWHVCFILILMIHSSINEARGKNGACPSWGSWPHNLIIATQPTMGLAVTALLPSESQITIQCNIKYSIMNEPINNYPNSLFLVHPNNFINEVKRINRFEIFISIVAITALGIPLQRVHAHCPSANVTCHTNLIHWKYALQASLPSITDNNTSRL